MPDVDGKGMDTPKTKTPIESVEGSPAKGTGGESEGKTWIKTVGPNPGKGGGGK